MMEQADVQAVHPVNEDEIIRPNHLIIWLDKHIGQPDECILLKCSLFMAVDPTTGLYERKLNKYDIDHSICNEASLLIQLDQVEFMFQAFDNVEKCFLAIEGNRDKRIFFITSGSKGRIIVPSLVANFPEKLIEWYPIYIFCAKMNMVPTKDSGNPTNDWALDYENYIIMYNHQDDLLARMVLDTATYLFIEAERLDNARRFNNALQHYRWSKWMYERYEQMENKPNLMKGKINKIDQCIIIIEQLIRQNMGENESTSKTCS